MTLIGDYQAGRLLARPGAFQGRQRAGCHRLELGAPRDGLLCVPRRIHTGQRLPLLVLLHGAGGSVQCGGAILRVVAEIAGAIVLAPESRGRTWDRIRGSFGVDVAALDMVLAQTFATYPVDPQRIALAGFSDGASYALSLGLTNGDMITHVIAFAPGFVAPGVLHGKPDLFIVHGRSDRVLPIDRCSRRIVPELRAAGYRVTYHEFAGGHSIPPLLLPRALRWFHATAAPAPNRELT